MHYDRPAADSPAPALRHGPGGALARPAWLLAWSLVLAIVLAPLLGQMHRVVHWGSIAGGAIHALQPNPSAGDWVHALFDGHGPAGCQLLEQHHHGLAGPSAAPVLPLPWAEPPLACPHPAVRDGRMLVAFFHARAPPPSITAAWSPEGLSRRPAPVPMPGRSLSLVVVLPCAGRLRAGVRLWPQLSE